VGYDKFFDPLEKFLPSLSDCDESYEGGADNVVSPKDNISLIRLYIAPSP
jgi:hypothetical protein